MGLFDRAKNYKSDVYDVALIKIAVFAGALFIAKLWPPILSFDWSWYLIIWIAAAIKPLYTFFMNK